MACQLSAEECEIKETLQSSQIIDSSPCNPEPKDYNTISHPNAQQLRHRHQKQRQYCYRQKGSIFDHLIYFFGLACASYVGVLTRIYLSKLANWNGVSLFPSLYPQMVGTIIMGIVTSHKIILTDKHQFFYTAIATGLCGSITTFSSWNSESVSILLQVGHNPPDNVLRILGWATTLFLGLGMPSGSYIVGRHLASLSPWSDSKQKTSVTLLCEVAKQDATSKWSIKLKGFLFMFTWIILTVLVVVIPYYTERLDLMFSALFASLGTYLRWHLAPLNSTLVNFKLGTFLVNVAGAWLLGAIVYSQGFYADGELMSALLKGLGAGFCGCLTTVSTFVVEMYKLPLRASYVYAFSSILVAQVGIILTRGSVLWTSE